MKNTTKIIVLAALIFSVSFGYYIYSYKGGFAIEFGESVEARNGFISLLKEHHISYQIETDHLGRIWVVPDQSKREEYEKVLKEWELKRTNNKG